MPSKAAIEEARRLDEEVLAQKEAGASYNQLARKYAVSTTMIQNRVNRARARRAKEAAPAAAP